MPRLPQVLGAVSLGLALLILRCLSSGLVCYGQVLRIASLVHVGLACVLFVQIVYLIFDAPRSIELSLFRVSGGGPSALSRISCGVMLYGVILILLFLFL